MPALSKMTQVSGLAKVAGLTGLSLLVCIILRRLAKRPPPEKILDQKTSKERKKLQVKEIKEISHDTKLFRFSTGHVDTRFGLPIGKHIRLYAPNPKKCLASGYSGQWNGRPDEDMDGKVSPKEIHRSYTPTPEKEGSGYAELVVKIYRPQTGADARFTDGGKMSEYLDNLRVGDWVTLTGPTGHIEYLFKGEFKVPGAKKKARHIGMMAGGTGITPMLQIVAAALEKDGKDMPSFSLIYANKTESDILVRDMLEEWAQRSNGKFKIHYTLDTPPEGWTGQKGFITDTMIKECLPPPTESPLIFMCGPPPMVEFACKKNLEKLGYSKDSYYAF